MKDAKSLCRMALLALVTSTALLVSTDGYAGGCKPNNQVCATPQSCCSRNCAKAITKKATALFGLCCAPGAKLVNGACCTPNCAGKNCSSDGCGGSCGTCAMSECDLTTGECVSCIPGGDHGCGSNFDCCSQVCGTGGVCESTTTTTTTSTTTSTTLCVTLTNSALTQSIDDEAATTASGNLITDSGAVDPDGDVVQVGSVSFDAATSSVGLTPTASIIVEGDGATHDIVQVFSGTTLIGTLDVNLSTGAYVFTNAAGAESLITSRTVEFTFSLNDGSTADVCDVVAGTLDVVIAGDDESTETTTTTITTTTTTLAGSCAVTGDNCQATSCAAGNACKCVTTTEGTPACVGDTLCSTIGSCTTSAECDPGDKCILNSCCGAPGICAPPCATPTCTCSAPG